MSTGNQGLEVTAPAVITIPEICTRLDRCETIVYRMLQDGTIPSLRPGGRGKYLVSRKRYEQWEATFGGVRG